MPKPLFFALIVIPSFGWAEFEKPIFYLIGEKVSIEIDTTLDCENCIPFDSKFQCVYKIDSLIGGSYKGDTIKFTTYDHYGTPEFSSLKKPFIPIFMDNVTGNFVSYRHYSKFAFEISTGGIGICAREGDIYDSNLTELDMPISETYEHHELPGQAYTELIEGYFYCKNGTTLQNEIKLIDSLSIVINRLSKIANEKKPLHEVIRDNKFGTGVDLYIGYENFKKAISPSFNIGIDVSLYLYNLGLNFGLEGSFGKKNDSVTINDTFIPSGRNAIKNALYTSLLIAIPIKHLYFEPFIGLGRESYFVNLKKGSDNGFDSDGMIFTMLGIFLGLPFSKGQTGFVSPLLKVQINVNNSEKNQGVFSDTRVSTTITFSYRDWLERGY